MIRIVTFLLIAYSLWLAAGCALQRKMLFPRGMTHPLPNAGEGVAHLEKLWLQSDQGRVEAWFIPGRGVDAEHPGPLMIFAHGNAELIDHLPDQLSFFTDMGVSLLLCEYRGYGRSAGSPSQKRITDDFIAMYDSIVQRDEVDSDRVIYYGRSVGAGVVCSLADHRKLTVMILQSPFTSVKNIMAGYLIPSFLVLDSFDNEATLRAFDGPVLLLHGSRDTIIPPTHSRKLLEVAPHAERIEYDAGHNDFPIDSPQYRQDVRAFLQKHAIIAQ
jgi:hypothetical protein